MGHHYNRDNRGSAGLRSSILYPHGHRQGHDRQVMREQHAHGQVWLRVGRDQSEAVAAGIAAAREAGLLSRLKTPSLLLSAERGIADGSLGRSLRSSLTESGIGTRVAEEPSRFGLGKGVEWRRVRLTRPDARLEEVSLPVGIVDAPSRISVSSVGADREGPIALDVLSRFTHPRLKFFLHMTPEREALVAEVNLACRLDLLIIAGTIGSWHIVALSEDPVATELFGLALREAPMLSSLELAGPWEDPMVQRSTELGLGVTLPSQLRLHVSDSLPCDLTAALDRIRLRLGMPAAGL